MKIDSPGRIITFYSYKGGTGRSMALANVAWILASNGKRVLVLDWDLEAPGLHTYFYPFLVDKELTDSDGVIDFVIDFAVEAMTPPETDAQVPEDWYRPYANILRYAAALDWDFGNGGILDFVPAGRQGLSYSARVNSFNWDDFYDRLDGGVFLEAVKEKMREAYDYILIDSRTGVSDTSGICTVQMPDILVVCFTLNNQSVEGAAAVVNSVYEQRRESGLQVLPVPMRIENAEQEKLNLWWEYAKLKFAPFPAHMPSREREQYWSEVAVPYVPYYAYEEILAIFGERHRLTRSLLASVEKLSAYLTQGSVERISVEESRREEILAQYEDKAVVRSNFQQEDASTPVIALDAIPSAAPLPHGSHMPLRANPLFVGRENELKALAAGLISATDTIAITGLGGIGKTQLASEFVHRYGQYFAGGVYWLSFTDPSAVPVEVAACGGAGRMELRSDFGNLSLEDQIREVMSEWQSAVPRLLVFDDCEEQELLEHWRPPTGGCRVLVTSRRERWDPKLGMTTRPLNVLSRQESIALLRKHRPDLPAEDQDLNAIAQELGDLPLALRLTGNYLSKYRFAVTLGDYLAQLRRLDPLRHPSLQEGGISSIGYEQNIARTFALSYEQLNTDDPTDALAVALLARAAFFAPGEPIPRDLLRSTLDLSEDSPETVLRAEDALVRLAELGLLGTQEAGALRLHRLLAVFVQERTAEAEAQTAVEVALLGTVGRLIDERDLAPLHGLYPHLRAATEAAKKREDEQAALLCNNLGSYLWMIGEYAEARPYLEHALAIRKKVLGDEHPETARSLNNLAMLLYAQGVYSRSRPLFERALAIRSKVLGGEHPETAESLDNLAMLLREQVEYEEARPLFERALEIREKQLGDEHPETARSLNNLAMLLREQGAYEEAHPYLEWALEIRKKVLGGEHPETAESLSNLGTLLYVQGAYAEARSYLERALEIREKVLGGEHPETAESLSNLGKLLYAQGDYAEARSYLKWALEIREKVLGGEHPSTAASLNHLAALLSEQGAYAEARSYLERALEIQEKVLGEEHLDTAKSLNNLATVLQAQGAYAEARYYLERTLKIRERVKGEKHPVTASSLNNLAALLYEQGVYTEARLYLERTLKIYENMFGEEHPSTAIYLNNLAMLLLKQGRYEEARPLFERTLKIQEKMLGLEHPYIAESFNNLATLLRKQAAYVEARHYAERALEIQEKVLGPEHPEIPKILNNLALLLYAQGDYAEAGPLFERALAIREKALGDEHPETAESLDNLAMLLREQGKYEEARPLFERALKIREKVLGPEHPETATGLNNMGSLLKYQGKHEEAQLLYERALTIREKVLGPDHPDTVVSFNNLATLYHAENN